MLPSNLPEYGLLSFFRKLTVGEAGFQCISDFFLIH